MEGVEPSLNTKPVTQEPSGNEVEGAKIEEFRSMIPRDQVSRWLGAGQEIIREKIEGGFFSEETKPQAERGLLYSGGDVNADSSKSLEAVLGSLKTIGGDEALKTREEVAAYVQVEIAEGGGKKFYGLEEWQEKLEQATPEERERLEKEGLYGFVFPEKSEKVEAGTTQSVEGKPQEDSIISEELSLLEGRIKKVLQKGGRPTEDQQQLIGALRLAKEANGEAGVLIKERALRDLEKSGVFGLENTIKSLDEQVPIANDKLLGYLKGQGWSEGDINGFIKAVSTGGIENMVREGKFPKVEGLDRLFFGRELEDEELERLLDPEKKKNWSRNALLFALLVSAIIPITLVQESTKTR